MRKENQSPKPKKTGKGFVCSYLLSFLHLFLSDLFRRTSSNGSFVKHFNVYQNNY